MKKDLCILALGLFAISSAIAAPKDEYSNAYISSGDNHFLGNSLAMDSEKSLYDGLEMLQNVFGARILYWRGMQEAAWAYKTMGREDNFRMSTFLKWSRHLINEEKLEPMIVRNAKKLGMEVWGVSTLGDWGSTADTPCFNDYPFSNESMLRVEHPEWVPVDKYGKRRQGGTIEFAYPEARKALVDLHIQVFKDAGYSGMVFLTYVENFSLRFEDEYGYSEPIVQEFKKRYGIDIRSQEFTKYGSKYDWHRLRGEYVTAYLRELKTELNKLGGKLGVFMNPDRPNYPMTWATLPHTHPTIGAMYMDYQTWIKDGIVDKLIVYGASARQSQYRTADEFLWAARGTNTSVGVITSGPFDPAWDPFRVKNVEIIGAQNEDEHFLARGRIPEQTIDALKHGNKFEQMRFLSQVILGKSKANAEDVIPLAKSENIVLRRLALHALEVIGDIKALPVVEEALYSPEVGIRTKAISALSKVHGDQSIDKLFDSIDKLGNHPEWEMARSYIPRMKPFPKDKIMEVAKNHKNSDIRNTALRILQSHSTPEMVDFYRDRMKDQARFVRYTAALNLASISNSKPAVDLLLDVLNNDADAAIKDRAAVSLGQMIKRNDLAAVARKSEILAALEKSFRTYGDGKNPADLLWGYRAIGEAFLYCGQDGENVLVKLMNNGSDKRLADYAWRILAYREKTDHEANQFNLITPKENDQLYNMRPAILKDNRIERLNQNFDDARLFNEKTSGIVGVVQKSHGRWGALNPDKGACISNAKANSGKQSLYVKRGGGDVLGWLESGIIPSTDFEIEMMVYRDKGGSFAVGAGAAGVMRAEILVSDAGELSLRNYSTSKWDRAGLNFPVDKWVKLTIISNINSNSLTAAIEVDGKLQVAKLSMPINGKGEINRISISPSGTAVGIGAYFDDIKFIEKR